MEYKVLALGDVASETGLQLLEKKLRAFKKEHDVRFTVVNGENISGSGLTKAQAEALFAAGADVITLGNTPSASLRSPPIWTRSAISSGPPTLLVARRGTAVRW